jgi:prolyl oligopeptidase
VKRSFIPVVFLVACGGEAPLPVPPPAPPPLPTQAATPAPPAFVPPRPYPASRRVDQVDDLHGTKVADPYRWLEDGNSDEVKQWLAAQDSLARSTLANLPGRDAIAARMKELLYVESAWSPTHVGNRWMYRRRDAGKEKASIYWREGKTGPEKVLLDPLSWSTDGSVSLGEWSPSWDGKKVAYTVHLNNSDEATMIVLDVASGKKSDVDVIEGARYAYASWTPSGDGFYYTWIPAKGSVPDAERPGYQEVRFHKLGTDPKTDKTIHERTGDPTTFVSAQLSKDGHWLVSTIQHGWTRYDMQFMDLRQKKPGWQDLAVGRDAVYDVSIDRDHFYLRTNDGAPKSHVFKVDPKHPAHDAWVEIVPERQDSTLDGVAVVGHRLALSYLKDVVSVAELHDEDGKLVRTLDTPALGALSGLSGDPDDDLVYYAFQSFTYPTKIFEASVKTGKTAPWYELKVPVDPTQFVVEQKFATSKDQTRIPYFLVRGKAMKTDGSTPTILTGYGGFQAAMQPYFAASIYPWLEQGGAWVVANLRGGSEYGEAWHRKGMLHEKQNVFDDLFAVAQALSDTGVATSSKLAVLGASNGGLLVGAAIVQHPEMFRVALCGVPLLDMVRYSLFGSGKTWMDEYGNPDDAADFQALYAYSPYHHVVQGTKYPATLVMSADSDDRVDPMHARKFAAELQWASTGGPVLLRVEKHSGHGGADMVKASIEKVADEYAFALDQMKQTP